MTYILIIVQIFITMIMSIQLMLARQNAVDYLLSLINIFTLFVLVGFLIEVNSKVNFNGSLVVIFGIMFLIILIAGVINRTLSYQVKGNSNLEG